MDRLDSQSAPVYLQVLRPDITLPFYSNPGDAGMDICAAVEMLLEPGETKLIPTGFALAIPEGYEVQIRPRSGISLKTMLRIPNSPGTIDSGYRDEVCIIMHNASYFASEDREPLLVSEKNNRHGSYLIRKGDKIAQMVFAPVHHMELCQTVDVKSIGNDRGGGFGSTGV